MTAVLTNLLDELVIIECRTFVTDVVSGDREQWNEIFRARVRGVFDYSLVVQVCGVSLLPGHSWLGYLKPVTGMLTSVHLRDGATRIRLVRDE